MFVQLRDCSYSQSSPNVLLVLRDGMVRVVADALSSVAAASRKSVEATALQVLWVHMTANIEPMCMLVKDSTIITKILESGSLCIVVVVVVTRFAVRGASASCALVRLRVVGNPFLAAELLVVLAFKPDASTRLCQSAAAWLHKVAEEKILFGAREALEIQVVERATCCTRTDAGSRAAAMSEASRKGVGVHHDLRTGSTRCFAPRTLTSR